jgi:Tfp pilus assembly protein PilZ
MAAVAQALGAAHDLAQALRQAAAQPMAATAARPAVVAARAEAPAPAPRGAAASPAVARENPPSVAKPKPPLAAAALAATDAEWKAVEAALGAHSATNFYKGLAGGDVVASGGLFVATSQVPPVGERLLLRVSMPGGYEFEARGVVAWTRDVALSSTASGATPGFGAQFSEISDEGRGLIQRYVRNREPLFHDDL